MTNQPFNIKPLREQAVALEARGKYQQARELLEQCLHAGPQDHPEQYISALYHLGVVCEKLGDQAKALDYFRQCLRHNTIHAQAARNIRRLSGQETEDKSFQLREPSIISLPSRATRRGFLLLGYPCDLDCRFCYYHFKKKPTRFMPLEHAKEKIDQMKYHYGCTSVDISGGEPTLYKELVPLIAYCREKGVAPTIITHGSRLDPEMIRRFMDNGLSDFLVSLHALGDDYDHTVGKKRFHILNKNLDYMSGHNIPFRTNSVVSLLNIERFHQLAAYLKEIKPKVCNFIVFNPGHEWREQEQIDFSAKYSVYRGPLHRAIDLLEPGITVNVRFYPFCFMKGYEKNNSNFPQQGYDPYEWSFYQKRDMDEAAVFDLYQKGRAVEIFHREVEEIPYNALARLQANEQYLKSEPCFRCSYRNICSGFSYNYARLSGFDEARPFTGELIEDPLYFRMQDPNNRVFGFGDHP